MDVKYDKIGSGYNSTRQADPYITDRLLHFLQPKREGHYLDIGCGTGNYTIVLADKGLKCTGVDPSAKMLAEASSRNQQIHWLIGTAEHIPTEDMVFDGIIATLTIHHWTDLRQAFTELSRVLKDDGKIILFTSTLEQMKTYWLNHYFPKMLHSSIVQMPSLGTIKEVINQTGLEITHIEKYLIQDDLKDCFLYVGKNNPVRYFDPLIRDGISSFTSLANIEEVKQGLSQLKNDIDGQLFEKVKNHYTDELGDYLFITLEKKGTQTMIQI